MNAIRRSLGLTILIAVAIGAALPEVCCAQRPGAARRNSVPRYVPATPTTSRYLALTNDTGGLVSSYYGVIRPQQRQAGIAQMQADLLTQQADEINALRSAQSVEGLSPTGQSAWFKQAPATGGFRDTSHYFFRWDERRLPSR